MKIEYLDVYNCTSTTTIHKIMDEAVMSNESGRLENMHESIMNLKELLSKTLNILIKKELLNNVDLYSIFQVYPIKQITAIKRGDDEN